MAAYQRQPQEETDVEVVHRLRAVTDPTVVRYITQLRRQFGKYATSPEETRRAIDAAMGEQKLTDLLSEIRRERP